LADAKRVLRSVGVRESKIRFSEAYKELGPDQANLGSVSLSGATFLSSFADHEQFTFAFTDSTSFDVVGDVTGTIGSGNTLELFTATGRFEVPIANWSGVAQAEDRVYITSNSDISDDDGENFIEDISKKINGELRRIFGDITTLTFMDSTSTETIPDDIQYAASRLTAYEIFTSVHAGVSIDEESPVRGWRKAAEESIEGYISSTPGVGPRWRSRDGLFTKIGVADVGEGEIDTEPIVAAKNKDFQR